MTTLCLYGECRVLFIDRLNVVLLSVVMLSIVAPYNTENRQIR
jgi:hypothetical protein